YPPLLYVLSPRPCTSSLYLHDALPIFARARVENEVGTLRHRLRQAIGVTEADRLTDRQHRTAEEGSAKLIVGRLLEILEVHHDRSEEHTSELQSRENLVCRLLLEKKKK